MLKHLGKTQVTNKISLVTLKHFPLYILQDKNNHWYSKRAFALLLTSKSEVNDEGEIVHNIGE
jgi:hypothetical protein